MGFEKDNNCEYFNGQFNIPVTAQSVYNPSKGLCKDNYNSQCPLPEQIEIACSLKLPLFDVYVFAILGSIAVICSCFILYTFYRYKKMRQRPGDLILAICISELLLILNWLWIAFYRFTYDISPNPFDTVCQVQSIFSIIGGAGEFVYNCAFCSYILLLIQNTLKGTAVSTKYMHLAAIVIIAGITIYTFASRNAGLSLFCTCSVFSKSDFSLSSVMGLVIIILYLVLSIGTLMRFQKKVPNNDQFVQMRTAFLDYYRTYVICTSVIWSFLSLSYLMVSLNSYFWQIPAMNVFISIGNTAKLGTPIALSITRFRDPMIRKKLMRQLRSCWAWFLIKCIGQCATGIRLQGEDMQQKLFDSGEEPDFFSALTNNLRVSQIYTIMAVTQIALQEAPQQPTAKLQEINENDCKDTYDLTVDDALISQYQNLKIDNYIINVAKVCLYSPRVSKSLIQFDNKMVDLDKSFSIQSNIKKIVDTYGSAGADGGASGEFQYFTADNRLMIKTMKQSELDSFLKNLLPYTHHLAKNQNSFISRIYAVLTINQGQEEKLNILIMRNIISAPREFIMATYDLKGSSVSRRVRDQNPNALLEKKTLKDLDFQEIERQIKILPSIGRQCSEILRADSQFLEQRNWLDYSLLVAKVNWADYCIQNDKNEATYLTELFQNSLQAIPSELEPGTYYQMAIIDYLQEWNQQKKAERFAKQITKLDVNIDISATDPKTYSERFIRKIAEGIFNNMHYTPSTVSRIQVIDQENRGQLVENECQRQSINSDIKE